MQQEEFNPLIHAHPAKFWMNSYFTERCFTQLGNVFMLTSELRKKLEQ